MKRITMIHEQELLEEILCRLPAKSIGRCRCVSKAWKSLLSQPHFIKTHLNRTKQYSIQEQSLIRVSEKFLYSLKLESAHQVLDEMMTPTMLNLGDHRFGGEFIGDRFTSCDGLIVVWDVNNKFMLINPTTREIKALPEPPCDLDDCDYENTIPGIGYDSHNDDYKVVTISFYDDVLYDCDVEDDMLVNVYSVKNGTWKTVDDSPYDHEAVGLADGGVFLNGHIHWIAKKTSDYSTVIAAFDLQEEKFNQVPHPSSLDGDNFSYGRLLIVKGCLCFWPYDWMAKEYECFLMKEYGVKESWTKFTITADDSNSIRPICLLGEEQMVLLKNENKDFERLVLYSVKERTSNEIKIRRFPSDLYVKGTFVESLLSPHFVYRDEAANEE